MRVVHLTDLHFQCPPTVSELFHLKRLMGSTNLYLLGRKSKFNLTVQRAAIQKAIELKPDLVIITGDISAQALRAEFELARAELDPLFASVPTILQAGNHDTYITKGPPPDMIELFGEWMTEPEAGLKHFEDVAVLCVESCRSSLLSQGYVAPESLRKATQLLQQNNRPFTFFCMHYPLLDRRGNLYGPKTRAIKNAPEVLDWLKHQTGMHIYLHGHEHHGYRTELQLKDTTIPSINPGSSGYAHDPVKDRRAHMALYNIDGSSISSIERFRYNEGSFEDEPNGPFSTGR